MAEIGLGLSNTVEDSVETLKSCLAAVQFHADKNQQSRLKDIEKLQQAYGNTLEAMTEWLDHVQPIVLSPNTDDEEDVDEQLRHFHENIDLIQTVCEELQNNPSSIQGNSTLLDNLTARVEALEERADAKDKVRKEKDAEKLRLKNIIEQVQNDLIDLRRQYADTMRREAPLERQREEIEQLDKIALSYEQKINELSENDFASSPDLMSLQSHCLELQQQAVESRAYLNKASSLQTQYEKVLQELSDFVETAQSKLSASQIPCRTVTILKDHKQQHNDFFKHLSTHCSILDSLSQSVDISTRNRHRKWHERVIEDTRLIEEKAGARAALLDKLIRDWTKLEKNMKQLTTVLEFQRARLTNYEESMHSPSQSAYASKIASDVHRVLYDRHPELLATLSIGKELLEKVNCQPLNSSLNDLGENWNDTIKIADNLHHRLSSIVEAREEWQREINGFEAWLSGAASRMETIKNTPIEFMIDTSMNRLLTLKQQISARVDDQCKIDELTMNLLCYEPPDYEKIENRAIRVKEEWGKLKIGLQQIESLVHMSRASKLPTEKALQHVLKTLTEIEDLLNSICCTTVSSRSELVAVLERLNEAKVQLESRQGAVDLVNNKATMDLNDDKIAESIGEMNNSYGTINGRIQDAIETLKSLNCTWKDLEDGADYLESFFKEEIDRLRRRKEALRKVDSVVAGLRDARHVLDSLKDKESRIENLRKKVKDILDKAAESDIIIVKDIEVIDNLSEEWINVARKAEEEERAMQMVLDLWLTHDDIEQTCNAIVSHAEYATERFIEVSGDASSLSLQLKQLENALEDSNSAPINDLAATVNKLVGIVPHEIAIEIREGVSSIRERHTQACRIIAERIHRWKSILSLWHTLEIDTSRFDNEFEVTRHDIAQLLVNCHGANDGFEVYLGSCITLKNRLEKLKTEGEKLLKISSQMEIERTTKARIISRLENKLERISESRLQLEKSEEKLKYNTENVKRIIKELDIIEQQITTCERYINNDTAIQSLEVLDNDMESLSEKLYKTALNENDSSRARKAISKWHGLKTAVNQAHQKRIEEANSTIKFTNKCEDWLLILDRAEKQLAYPIAFTNPTDLKKQAAEARSWNSQLSSRHSAFHSIIADAEVAKLDESKIDLMREQWESVILRADERHRLIDEAVNKWNRYEESKEKLSNSLKTLNDELNLMLSSKAPSLQSLQINLQTLQVSPVEYSLKNLDIIKDPV